MRPATEITDPFFAALRARRPDMDLVLLPPEMPPEHPPSARPSDDPPDGGEGR